MQTKQLPLDPEEMNEDRAAWAESAIRAFEEATGADRQDTLCDLITDLAHWCDRNNTCFSDELERARSHYQAETENTGTQL